MLTTSSNPHTAVCLALTRAISRAKQVDDIYAAALEALTSGLGVERSSILLFDADGVMRFKAHRGLSEAYRRAVEGHSPWRPDSIDPAPIVTSDVTRDPGLAPYLEIIQHEGIASMAFVPLCSGDRVIGKFMLYFPIPHTPTDDELQLAGVIAAQVAFAVEKTRAEDQARRSEERLRFALDASQMGTWDWDLRTNQVIWSENLERIHGLPPGTFDGSFASYEREIHPDDRERVLASAQRAVTEGVPHDVEYRLVAPDGTVRWCEGKGRVEYENGVPARMTGVCVIVTPRKEAELARLATAQETSRVKDEFLATLSHEMRTPLNAILGWVQIVQNGALPPERQAEVLEVIARNARLQSGLIDDVLDVSRIITGKLEVERMPVLMTHVVDAAVSSAQPSIQAKQIDLRVSFAHDIPPIEGDPTRLQQVINNILSNAVKFTPERGTIELRCTVDQDHVRVEIRDSGVGIPPEFLPYVFDRFRQADSSTTRRHGGLGLGLAIASHLVALHGGRIEAHSDGDGHGSSFAICLPLHARAREAQARKVQARLASDIRLNGIAAVVVEDQDDSRELLALLLESRGAQVLRCDSARSALSVIEERQPQLIVADIAMPDMDGYELMQVLRSRGCQTPAIAVTAYARRVDYQRAIAAGYGGYCAKPIDAQHFLGTVAALVVNT